MGSNIVPLMLGKFYERSITDIDGAPEPMNLGTGLNVFRSLNRVSVGIRLPQMVSISVTMNSTSDHPLELAGKVLNRRNRIHSNRLAWVLAKRHSLCTHKTIGTRPSALSRFPRDHTTDT